MDNFDFIRDYIEFAPDGPMQPKTVLRSAGDGVAFEVMDQMQSGDGLAILRNDGLDPMLGWASGSSMGHTAILMRDSKGELHVCESTTKDAYWPTNGIQTHPFKEWVGLVHDAQMAVVWLPLTPERRAKFNADKAWDFFDSIHGVNYGFPNLLTGWLDTPTDNFPCVPPDFKTCLKHNAVEILAMVLDPILGASNTNIFRQTMNFRAGLPEQDKPVIFAAFNAATKLNRSFTELYTLPENDDWRYVMTMNNGTVVRAPSSVCCVFVCRMWKAGGMFSDINDELNCAEFATNDIWNFDFFDNSKMGNGRPEACRKADPDNTFCQIQGLETLRVQPNFNSRKPMPWMMETCPSQTPFYKRPSNC